MKYYGALFKNSKKETDNQPDYTGILNNPGAEQGDDPIGRVSGWIKTSKAGNKYISLSIQDYEFVNDKPAKKEPTPKKEEKPKKESSEQGEIINPDDLPF